MPSTCNDDRNWSHSEGGNSSKRLTPWTCQLYQRIYWPTDSKKIPDLLDFGITRGIFNNSCSTESSLDLSSDHSPVIITLTSKVITKGRPRTLHNAKTDWSYFQELLTTSLNNSIPIKTENDIISAVESFNHEVQAALDTTPVCKSSNTSFEYSSAIKDKLAEKRKLRKLWQINRCPVLKTKLNKLIKALKNLLERERNQGIQRYLSELSPSAETNYSLWKATKRLKRPQIQLQPISRMEDGPKMIKKRPRYSLCISSRSLSPTHMKLP